MKVKSKLFKSSSRSWDAMCEDVSEFASTLGPERLINISMSAAGGVDIGGAGAEGVIIVWYWD
jgi:hypothetical protein